MDPVTIVGLVEGSISLAVQCGSVAKSLNTLAGQYKYAKLTISTMVQNLDIMQLAWGRIGAWSKDYIVTEDDDFTKRLERSLETGFLVLDALEEDLQSYDASKMTFRQRSRLAYPPSYLTKLLLQSKKQFMKSDESAFSIVPSRLSSRLSMSTNRTGGRDSIGSDASMVYRRLSFEDDLFTARVYKRNYRNPRLQQLWKPGFHSDPEIVSPQKIRGQYNGDFVNLKLQRFSEATNTNDISSETINGDAEQPVDSVLVTTSCSVSTNELDRNLEIRVDSSTSDLYVRLVQNLEHRLRSSIADSYVRLVKACARGDEDSVKRQLAMMPASTRESPEAPGLLGSYTSGSLYFCPIHAAVFNGHAEVMKTLLRRADLENDTGRVVEKAIGGTSKDCWRPLHVAAMKGNLPMVQLLLEKGASIHSETGHGIQAIHLAARIGSMEVLQALLDAGADVNCADRDGRPPLHYISESRDRPDVILYLAERGATISKMNHLSGLTPLHLACKNNFTGNIEVLLSLGVNMIPGATSALGNESPLALDTAIRSGSPSTVEFLIKLGLDPNCCRWNGDNGLKTFVLAFYVTTGPRDNSADKRILQLLLDHTDLLVEKQNGQTVLSSLFHLGGKIDKIARLELAKLILENLPEHKVLEKSLLKGMISKTMSP